MARGVLTRRHTIEDSLWGYGGSTLSAFAAAFQNTVSLTARGNYH